MDVCQYLNIPWGYHFRPGDDELVKYLYQYEAGGPEPSEELIRKEDIFGDKEPWELFRCNSGEKVQYFFTQLKMKAKKSMEGSRFERTVGKKVNGKRPGTWHGQDKGSPVLVNSNGALLGYKRSFLYKNENEKDHHKKWLLKEFYLCEDLIKILSEKYPTSFSQRKSFVLCALRKKEDEETNTRSRMEGVGVEMALEFLEDDTSEAMRPLTESR
ncbi:NAC domain-containing protein 96-like [Ipomoea triloba]|uniref:NAC domain-containing protein 96-like n=1 Tax=Ipomoea triloba TaxID=35885 RepID=UPI00125D4A1E|nr:NAC domain-containing protein 96-like [Ipomoea triloba]